MISGFHHNHSGDLKRHRVGSLNGSLQEDGKELSGTSEGPWASDAAGSVTGHWGHCTRRLSLGCLQLSGRLGTGKVTGDITGGRRGRLHIQMLP